MSLNIGMLVESDEVAEALRKVESLSPSDPQISMQSLADWCSP
jgi:hypothetical protein